MYTGYQTNGFLNEFLKATHPTTHQRLRQSTLAVLLIEEGIKPKEEEDNCITRTKGKNSVQKLIRVDETLVNTCENESIYWKIVCVKINHVIDFVYNKKNDILTLARQFLLHIITLSL